MPPKIEYGDPSLFAEQCVGTFHEFFHVTLDYSEQSLDTIENVVNTHLHPGHYSYKNFPHRLASLIGCYMGELLIRHLGARWGKIHEDPERSGIPFVILEVEGKPQSIFVVPQVIKRLQCSTNDENLTTFFQKVKKSVATNKVNK